MMNFIKLANFEINRISKLLFSLMAFVLVAELAGVIYLSMRYLNRLEEIAIEQQLSRVEVLESMSVMPLSFHHIINSVFFNGPIFICVGAILFYIFLIWYRDWFGKNTFIYRLLMLPTERINIYLAKLATIVIATLSLVAFQIIALLIERFIFHSIVPADLRSDASIHELIANYTTAQLIVPNGFDGFLIMYGIGIMSVIMLFTVIMLERSYRLKGIAIGVVYSLLSVGLIVAPMILNDDPFFDHYFYVSELLMIEAVISIIILAFSIWISRKLLNDKVRV